MTYIQGQGLQLTYATGPRAVEVFRDVSFSIDRGSIVAIIGPSGCGKTSLLNCIGGLQRFQGGRLNVDGKAPDLARRERYFGLVPQEPCLFEWKTVEQNIGLPYAIFGDSDKEATGRRIQQLIDLVGLTGFERAYPYSLSGGMKQRGSLARALSFAPPILLMDEPFGALDAQTREHMNLEVLRIWGEIQNTVVLITHDVTEAVLLSDRIFVMSQRPSTIREVLDVDLPRPRGRDTLDSVQLLRYTREIRAMLAPQA